MLEYLILALATPQMGDCLWLLTEQAVAMGASKAQAPFDKTFLSAILAGAYVGFGGMLALCVGANLPEIAATNPGLQKMILGGFGLPAGLMMVAHHSCTSVEDARRFNACLLLRMQQPSHNQALAISCGLYAFAASC